MDSIDDYLGDGKRRFFASGYRRAEYQVTNVRAMPEGIGEAGTTAVVTVRYPADWSKKTDEIDLPPHLSSVDTLLLGVQLSEAHLEHARGVDPAELTHSWLRRITLQAGMTPQEELSDLPAVARLRETRPSEGSTGAELSVYDCRIGAMRARLEIEHPAVRRPARKAAEFPTLDDALGPAAARYFGDGFKQRTQVIEQVRADLGELTIGATVAVETTSQHSRSGGGIEGAYQPSWSPVDCFVVNLQLAQVLMYEMDSVSRSDSNTLWMQRTALTADTPHRPYGTPFAARARVSRNDLLRLRGGDWRNIELTGDCGGVGLRCSLAHELPADALARTR